MADNVTLNAGTGGDTIAADDVGGAKYQRVKLSLGADGTVGDAPVGNGTAAGVLRVTLASDGTGAVAATLAAETTKVIGTVNIAASQTVATVTNVATIGTSVTPGTAAANLGKAEDAAHTSGDVGVMSLAVRRDADTALVGTDGDYAPLQVNSAGSLKVAITAGAGSGGTSIADGASFTRDTTSITPVGGVVESSAPTVTAGDAVALSLTTGGAVRVAVASGGVAGVVEDAASSGGEEGILAMAVRRDTAASSSGTDGDFSTLNTDANGRLHVIAAIAATQTLATVTTVSTVTNVATIGTSVTPGTAAANLGKAEDAAAASGDTGVMALAVRTDTAAASSGTTGDYEALHTDSVGALWNRSTAELADDAAFTPGTSRVMPAGFQADEASTDSVDEGDAGAARMTLDRKIIVTVQPHTQGGLSIFRSLDIDETEEDVKTSAGQLYFIHAMNMVATARYLKFYNATAANVTVGSTTPVLTFPVPANSTTGAGFTVAIPQGFEFSTAISVACTTGVADADTGAPGANDVIINIGYK